MSLVRCPHSLGCIHYVYCRGVEGRRCCLKRQNFLRPPPPTAYRICSQAPFPPLDQKKKLHFTLYIERNTNLSKRGDGA